MDSRSLNKRLCPLCSFASPSIAVLLSHLRLVHSSDPRFVVCCGINGCTVTSRSFSSLYSHVYRHHPDANIKRRGRQPLNDEPVSSGTDGLNSDLVTVDTGTGIVSSESDINRLTGYDVTARRRSSALLLLKLREQRRVSQVAIDDIVESSKAQFDLTLTMILASVRSSMAEKGIDVSGLDLESSVRMLGDPFAELDTKYKQEKYFKETLGLIEPQEIRIGNPEFVRQFTGSKSRYVERYDTYHYIPILSTIQKLLADPSVMEQIEQCPMRIRTDGIIEDFCDATRFKTHPLFSEDECALQIIGYFDELEVCNPLGTHVKKHKVGIVFFTLGNLHPKFRSTFKAMNLAIVATKPVIEKHGMNVILKPFIDDLNKLATEGVTVRVRGADCVFRGALLTFLADNLASNELGGFKLSFSFSFRCCRTCLVVNEEMSQDFNSDKMVKRNAFSHEDQCKKLEGPTKNHYSKTYGINHRTSLLDVKHYSIFDGGLAHDYMHDVLEGVAPIEVKLLLHHCVSEKYFSLEEFNKRLVHFNYGYTESDRPVPILQRHFQSDRPLRSSASQMSLLVHILPFLVGDKIPESDLNWNCFLLLRKIVDILTCPVVTQSIASSLKLLIKEHHTTFLRLYPTSFIPKMHFIIHYPEQLLQLGPMTRTWTIRYEAKLNFFKQASGLSSFKNITLSLANHHQRWICYEMATGNLLRTLVECGPCKSPPTVFKNEPKSVQQCLAQLIPGISTETAVTRPNWVRKDGVLYKNNNAYIIVDSDGLDPVFAQIDEVLVIGGDLVLFNVRYCDTSYFDEHYHAYAVNLTSRQSIVTVANILDRYVYHSHKLSDGVKYVSLKYLFMP